MISIKGIAEAQRALEEIAASVERLTSELLPKAGKETINLVKARTPVRTGRLRDNHQMKVIDDNTIELFSPVEYAAFVEYGTSRQLPQPHWGPAIERLRRLFPDLYIEEGSAAVDAAISRNKPS